MQPEPDTIPERWPIWDDTWLWRMIDQAVNARTQQAVRTDGEQQGCQHSSLA